jgi:hypothetical protein
LALYASSKKNPRQIKRVGAQSSEYAEFAVLSGGSIFVTDDYANRLPIRRGKSAALHGFCSRRRALQKVKSTTETNLLLARPEFCGIA